MEVNYIMNKNSIILVTPDETRVYAAGSNEYEKAKLLIVNNDEAGLYDMVNELKEAIKKAYVGFKVENDIVFVDGEPLPRLLGQRLKSFADEGAPYEYLLKFWKNLKNNPSHNSVNNLFDFLERNHCPINEDGHIIAYKTVKSDYYDKYSGTILNKPGTGVEFARNKVDDNRNNECSNGLHVGSLSYTNWYGHKDSGDRLLMVSVDPADCVSVPTDHNYTKMRVCKYFIVKEVDWSETESTSQVYKNDNLDACANGTCDCDCDEEDDEWDLDDEDEDDWDEEDEGYNY